jgi:hypothetical protein
VNWILEAACSLDVRRYDHPRTTVVKVCLIADRLDRFCLGLCLLNEDLIDRLDLVDTPGARVFRLRRSTGATSIALREDEIKLALDGVALEAWLYFTLRAVRDGMAEVDHMDFETRDYENQLVDVIVQYPSSAPAVSPEEARRRLEL